MDWNGEAENLTHKAREDGPTWNGFPAEEGVGAIRVHLAGGVNHEKDKNVKNKIGAGWILQIAETIGHQSGLQWKAVVEVARVLDDECRITEAQLMAAAEAARALICSTKTSNTEFDNRDDCDEEVDGSKGDYLRWIDTSAMQSDCLTKIMTTCRSNETLSTGIFDMRPT